MNASPWPELIGYAGSGLVVLSHTMRSIRKLRLINLGGALCMITYGLLIKAYPVVVVNGLITCINIRYLVQMYSAKEYFTPLEVRPDSAYLGYFLRYYAHDIQRFLPGFIYQPSEGQLTLFILRDLVPAGLFIATPMQASGAWLVKLDYVIPGYRDFKTGRYLFSENTDLFKRRGIRRIYTEPGSSVHTAYLRRMGFRPAGGAASHLYCLEIDSE